MDRTEEDILIRGDTDSADEDKEVDVFLGDSRSTVHMPQQAVASGETTALGSNASAESTHENLGAMVSYLLDEMKNLKLQIGAQRVPIVEFSDKPGLEDHATSRRRGPR